MNTFPSFSSEYKVSGEFFPTIVIGKKYHPTEVTSNCNFHHLEAIKTQCYLVSPWKCIQWPLDKDMGKPMTFVLF